MQTEELVNLTKNYEPNSLRILIVAEHASLEFGGEAALPLHYFQLLRRRNIETWLIVHERTKSELEKTFPQEQDRIFYIKDTFWHRLLWQLGKPLPQKISYITFGLLLRIITQINQRKLAKKLVKEKQIELIHQPIPVSPKEPSLLYNMGVPVVIGPMNGGMNYPPGFQAMDSKWVSQTIVIGRLFANFVNRLIPGKYQATTLLVANSRTRDALPSIVQPNKIIELVENGVDLSIWEAPEHHCSNDIIRFVFVGRLVDWKAVDLLLLAVKKALETTPLKLDIIGDGDEKKNLEAQVIKLDLSTHVNFLGWLSQKECAQHLQQSSCLILPSLYECGGAVVLEAMAMGIPVIATNWGGPADYLDENCGILVEPKSPQTFIDGLANAMIKLAQNPEMCQNMGQSGYKKVREQFDWEKKIDKILEIYNESIKIFKNGEAS
ncbi:MAG: glycosyltransferase family 4 protein [Gomphosphaeria aponina SAG 52.96 = DSM 107014]|uniref:Glycosyltransferase family 4 protein n=1 Tax=Gomphosphaeria aponina SAG 52.96 = DSM 107014 TaxID=1521640 RepID=A0A941JP03_9CHRO|nr:glycosyltransferase family 4 protein [Gomphosphaeria aponina SAG 52.96 = DSM 107014]